MGTPIRNADIEWIVPDKVILPKTSCVEPPPPFEVVSRMLDIPSVGVVTDILYVKHEPQNLSRAAPDVDDAITSLWSDEAVNYGASPRSPTEYALDHFIGNGRGKNRAWS
jgi:hypothetical protein